MNASFLILPLTSSGIYTSKNEKSKICDKQRNLGFFIMRKYDKIDV